MFIPFYEDRSKFDIARGLFTDAAWLVGYVVGFVIGFTIAVYEQFATPTQTITLIEASPETVQPSPSRYIHCERTTGTVQDIGHPVEPIWGKW